METQTTVLDVVASRADTRHNTKDKCSTTATTKSTKATYTATFFTQPNTCQNQPQSENEIFQPNVRPQNSKESNSPPKLKILFVGNLNKNTSEEDLYELSG